ncbi:MAG: NADP-dependent oxidoreductase [Sphingomonadales bacterium]
MTVNHQWQLASRPDPAISVANFVQATAELAEPSEGQIVVRVTHIAYEPAMRGWVREVPGHGSNVKLNGVMRSQGAGEVIASRHPDFQAGDRVTGFFGWQQYAVVDVAGELLPVRRLPDGVTEEMALSVLGITGLTAYFGMLDVGRPKAGDTVVVSGAAGATGSIAGQLALISGCRVIGIAGGADKCRWLTEEAGFDAAIDYKTDDVSAHLQRLAPSGINVFYDNVGGSILEAALDNIAIGSRIVICGGISGYNVADGEWPGPRNYMRIVNSPSTMSGFLLGQFASRFPEAWDRLGAWVRDGHIRFAVDVQEGFDNVPATLMRLFHGQNLGKQLCRIG